MSVTFLQLDTIQAVWSGMLYNYYQKVRHVLWLSSRGVRQPSFLLAHRWDLESWGGGVACWSVSSEQGSCGCAAV